MQSYRNHRFHSVSILWVYLFAAFVLFGTAIQAEEVSVPAASEKTPISAAPSEHVPAPQAKNIFFDASAKLLLVLGAVYILFFLLKRFYPGTAPLKTCDGAFGVQASIPLTVKSRLVLVRFGSKLLLLSVGGDRTEKIAESADPGEIEAICASLKKKGKNE